MVSCRVQTGVFHVVFFVKKAHERDVVLQQLTFLSKGSGDLRKKKPLNIFGGQGE